MILLALSSATRLYHLKKNVPDMAPAAWINSIIGVLAFAGPLVAIAVVTIISLRGEEAAQVLLSLQLAGNHIEEARQSLAKQLSGSTPSMLPLTIANVQRLLSRMPDRARAVATSTRGTN